MEVADWAEITEPTPALAGLTSWCRWPHYGGWLFVYFVVTLLLLLLLFQSLLAIRTMESRHQSINRDG